VKDSRVHQKVIEHVVHGIESYGFACSAAIDSPILGTSGNKEFLVHCTKILGQ
jgi:predicted rRNA methylase YqxC with S4 and FtsJ domains